jgi:uncharacterized protein YukE
MPATPPHVPHAAEFNAMGMTVTPENVLAIRSQILSEAERLSLAIQNFQTNHPAMPVLGGDPVSHDAAQGFTETANELVQKCRAAADGYRHLGEQLAEAARAYQKSEDEIKNSFSPGQMQYQPQPVVQGPYAEISKPEASRAAAREVQ